MINMTRMRKTDTVTRDMGKNMNLSFLLMKSISYFYFGFYLLEWPSSKRRDKCRHGHRRKRTSVHCWWKCQLVWSLWENRMEVPPNIKNRSVWSRNSTSSYVSRENKSTILRTYQYPHVHCSTIYSSHDMGKNLGVQQRVNR